VKKLQMKKIFNEIFATPLRMMVAGFLVLCLASGGIAAGARIMSASASGNGQSTVLFNYTDLLDFANRIDAGWNYSSAFVRLGADIDMAGLPWSGIGTAQNPFRGTFDGNGYRISNLTSQNGLFNFVLSGEIRNVHLVDVEVENTLNVADTTTSNTTQFTGAIVGFHGAVSGTGHVAGALTIRGCTVNGGTVHGQGHTGGIIGQSSHDLVIVGCSVIADVSSDGTAGLEIRVGGIVGQHTAHTVTVSNSFLSGVVSATAVAREAVVMSGGMVGYLGAQSIVRDCYVEGSIQVTGTNHRGAWVGGVVGNINFGNGLIERNFVSATMFASATNLAASGVRYTRVGGVFTSSTNATQSIIRNNAITTSNITAETSPVRVQAGVGISVATGVVHSFENNNQLYTLDASVGSVSGWSRHNGTLQPLGWFEGQETFEDDLGWCFAEDWIMFEDENGIRPIPKAYKLNVLEFEEKDPMDKPNGNTTEGDKIKELEDEITTLTKERDELKEQAGANEARLAELENELREALAELQDKIDEMKANTQTPTDPNRNAFDIWLVVSVVLAVACVALLATMIILGRRNAQKK
jgi:hypothetical protein